jgi:hypothetical protein
MATITQTVRVTVEVPDTTSPAARTQMILWLINSRLQPVTVNLEFLSDEQPANGATEGHPH